MLSPASVPPGTLEVFVFHKIYSLMWGLGRVRETQPEH